MSGLFTTSSEIATIPDALDLVQRLRGVEFYWAPASERPVGKALSLPLDQQQVGFVAQEVEKVVPEAVSSPPGADGVYGVDSGKIVAVLVEAVKLQQREIASQQREISSLQAALAELKPRPAPTGGAEVRAPASAR